jgi:hypothetical protein
MKTCKADGCYYPIWGGSFCQRHQWMRTDKKKKKLQGPKVTQVKDFSKAPDFGFEGQQELFAWLWQEAKDRNGIVTCPFTGQRLNRFYGTDLWWSCFLHYLPKGRYTYWKLNPKNVVVAHPDFHRVVDQGTSLARINHPTWKFDRWDTRREELKIEYDLFKKQNLLP